MLVCLPFLALAGPGLAAVPAHTAAVVVAGWPLTGKVVSEKGEPLPGVTVLVKGTTIGASTNAMVPLA